MIGISYIIGVDSVDSHLSTCNKLSFLIATASLTLLFSSEHISLMFALSSENTNLKSFMNVSFSLTGCSSSCSLKGEQFLLLSCHDELNE